MAEQLSTVPCFYVLSARFARSPMGQTRLDVPEHRLVSSTIGRDEIDAVHLPLCGDRDRIETWNELAMGKYAARLRIPKSGVVDGG